MANESAAIEFFKKVYGGAWITQALWVAADLGIADLLAAGPLPIEVLAQQTQAHTEALYRVLRALASIGVFSQDDQNRFSLTPLANLLRSDVPCSQRSFAIMMGAEFHETWGQLLYSAKTGKQGFQKHYGATFFEYMTAHPDRHDLYDAAMTGIHGAETEPMLDAYDFSQFGTVADIGGGNGSLLAGILNRHPGLKGILFDLPAVADRARPAVSALGLSERCWILGGDFFSSIPSGADAYVMRHIIHDWEDHQAIAILQNCRQAMPPKGRVLLIEHVVGAANEPGFGKWLDLMMLLVGGRERTQSEFEKLFLQAGLKLNRIIPTSAEVCVIEGIQA